MKSSLGSPPLNLIMSKISFLTFILPTLTNADPYLVYNLLPPFPPFLIPFHLFSQKLSFQILTFSLLCTFQLFQSFHSFQENKILCTIKKKFYKIFLLYHILHLILIPFLIYILLVHPSSHTTYPPTSPPPFQDQVQWLQPNLSPHLEVLSVPLVLHMDSSGLSAKP